VYKTGDDFCQAMNFEVVKGNADCFDFDATVFGRADRPLARAVRALYAVPFLVVSAIFFNLRGCMHAENVVDIHFSVILTMY